jgi:hypothetical protein
MGLCSSFQDDARSWNELGKADIKHNFMSEAVVGSLPRGLSFDERSRIFANTPASPIVQSLQAVSEVGTSLSTRVSQIFFVGGIS